MFLTCAINAYIRRMQYWAQREFSTKRLIYRFAFLLLVTSLCVSCTSTDFQSWEGRNSVAEGRGGTRKVVDGMDVWTHGDPPRRFKVLGIIEDERPGGVIPMAQLKHDIVDKARQSGGDAVILFPAHHSWRGTIRRAVRAHTVTEIPRRLSVPLRPCRSPDVVQRTSLFDI